MDEKDIQNLIDLAQSLIQAGVTAEQAKRDLVAAGIFNANGEYTAPFQKLLDEAMEQ